MADYYSLLSRAIDALPRSPPEVRQAIYQRARNTLLAHLRNMQPPIPESKIVAEEHALDEAITRVEQTAKNGIDRAGPGNWLSELLSRASGGDAPAPLAAGNAPAREQQRPAMLHLQGLVNGDAQLEKGKSMSRLDNLNRILRKLQSDSPGLEASALISEDGLMIASSLAADMEETRVAGMAATLQSLGGRATVELARGDVREVVVRGERGYAVMISTGRGVLLLAVANESSRLGLIFFDMHEAIKALENIL